MKKIMMFFVAVTILFGSALFAEKMMKMTPEQRESMAKAHEQMAVCLRSDKMLSECHDEMMKECEKTMGKECKKMMMHNGMHKQMKMKK